MLIIKEAATLVGFSELRTKAKQILRAMGKTTVILERRRKPVAVMLPVEKFRKMESLLDWVEDQALGLLAKKREKGTSRKNYLSLEQLKRRLHLARE
ncbi:MAG: type II toxin-antitoxin system Phd/YefM family antitoxin [Candidatus Omnitrophica bacterium]|nr:type II toxin-antitoxin system Phd/YefM family antitoxin [Candidatus Omnitrophota bacterium]